MSIKKYFEVAENIKSLSNKSADDIASQIESTAYHEQDIIEEERFIPRIDFSDPKNFTKYGSAVEYYDRAIKRIYNEFPYDGSLRERLEWQNESSYIDLHIYDNLYPRTNGHVIFSVDGWGTRSGAIASGYGLPTTQEYIFVKGGPHPNSDGMSPYSTQFTGSNYYELGMNRGSNLECDFSTNGASVEFWLNKTEFIPASTEKEVIFDLWNGEVSSSTSYFRMRLELSGAASGADPFLLTVLSGTTGFSQQSLAASTFTTASVADSSWHHYGVTLKSASAGVTTRFYVDGDLNNSVTLGTAGINDTDSSNFRAHLGALITAPSGTSVAVGAGKLSASLDEFRFWKKERTSKEIGRFWFTQVGGGVNTDPKPFVTTKETANIDLGVYYKFNEGITGDTATDSIVLDYSGRVSNGVWTGYGTNSRNTDSAIVLSTAATSEFLDPIIYPTHPDVVTLIDNLQLSGSSYDVNNNASIYNSMPSWILEEDNDNNGEIKKLTQIISSYFDSLHLQIENINTLKSVEYLSGSDKPLPFAEKLLASQGFVAPEIFLDADVIEKLLDRSEDRVYEKSLHDTKNIIYQNIYNNLNYIYKSKGTEKAFRNLIRCFGIDDELIKFNMYANNVEYEVEDNRSNVIVSDKFINFNTGDNSQASVYNFTDASNSESVGFITSSSELTSGFASTLEAEFLFPLKLPQESIVYSDTNAISSSLFGMHGTEDSGIETTWPSDDAVNLQVYAVRDELNSDNARFVLTGTAGGFVPELSSSLFEGLYSNTRWNLSVRIKPENYPLAGLVGGTTANYIVELHGIQAEAGEIINEFSVSETVASPSATFTSGSKRVFVGAHRTNFTGALLQTSDVKVNACRYWVDYVDDQALRGHILDTENHGVSQPHLYAYEFNPSASYGDISKLDTLAFNWEFLENTGSDASGQFFVEDISSGSNSITKFGEIGNIVNKQYTARGDFFLASSTTAVDKDFVVSSKLNLPENIQSQDMVTVLNAQEQDVFTTESRPINYFFAFEKSMYQVISKEIINYFASLRDIHNLVGDPVEKYRPEYKQLRFVRQKFFEKVANDELDFDKFYEFYKWFDSSLSLMLSQLVPASADFSENIRTIIENHVLERPKYTNKFPILEKQGASDITSTSAQSRNGRGWGGRNPPGGPAQTNNSQTRRQIGSSNPVPSTSWRHFHAPVPSTPGGIPPEQKNQFWHRYKEERSGTDRDGIHEVVIELFDRVSSSPVKFSVDMPSSLGGSQKHKSYDPNYSFVATAPYGSTVSGSNIPVNIMVTFDTDVETLVDTTDEYNPVLKQRLGFGMDPSINTSADTKADGNMYAPFSLYSSSITTGHNAIVATEFKEGVEITNLHHDYVFNTDASLQGPFPEKFVGGRKYRHTVLNDGSDTRFTRAEGFRLEFGSLQAGFSGALGVVPPNYPFVDSSPAEVRDGWRIDTPTAFRFRDETAKRPVNIKNILMTTASLGTRLSGTLVHNPIGNYQKNYQVIQTSGRSINDPFFQDQSFVFAANPETIGTRGRFILSFDSTANSGGDLDYALPYRTGSNSNKTVFVNLFSSPGSWETLSRGYLDPAHEELSVYNALPYRNLSVISRGMSGSDTDNSLTGSVRVNDHIGKPRGLNQLSTLHAGQFGHDPVFGSVPTSTYVTLPSYHKTNRNRRRRIELSGTTTVTGSVFDNLFIQHTIPRSEQQYAWITSSLGLNEIIYGLDKPSCFSASTLSEVITTSVAYANADFVGLRSYILDTITSSTHILGEPLTSTASSSYYNSTLALGLANESDYFNTLMLNRNGPFGYPMWKQIRTGEHPVARNLRKNNQIGYALPPVSFKDSYSKYVYPVRPNTFNDFYEAPLARSTPTAHFFIQSEDSETENNVILSAPVSDHGAYFSNENLNNYLGLTAPDEIGKAFRTIASHAIDNGSTMVVSYGESIYPSKINAFDNKVRRRTQFIITNIWDDNRDDRSLAYGGLANSQGVAFRSSSIFPLDAHMNYELTTSVLSADGAGELMNSYSRFANGTANIRPAATYAARVPAGSSSAGGDKVFAGDAEWLAPLQSGKSPYESYDSFSLNTALVKKDYSIVPEFRISELMEDYLETNEEDFLAELDNVFSLTGASIPDSSETNFFKTYTNSDFLKYFSVVDLELNGKGAGSTKVKRDKISLKCAALLKFLPYKGFYPAERTVELASLFSQSYAPTARVRVAGTPTAQQGFRTLAEPLFSPGILFNTIKSGIAVDYFVLTNTGSDADTVTSNEAIPTSVGINTTASEGTIKYDSLLDITSNDPGPNNGYLIQSVPFRSLYSPQTYFSGDYLTGSGVIFDNAIGTQDRLDIGVAGNLWARLNGGKKLYELAIDNFLCESTNFFVDGLTNFKSNREDSFKSVVSGTTYTMALKMYRTKDVNLAVDRTSFDMYIRESAFGPPMAGTASNPVATFDHVTPPYFSGSSDVTFTYTAQATGIPSLDDVLSNTTTVYTRETSGDDTPSTRMNVDSCFNLTDYLTEVPKDTNAQKKRWLIQSKFETPILNFAGVSSSQTATSLVDSPLLSKANEIRVTGMWHQYGSIPTSSQEGVFVVVDEGDQNAGTNTSLAEIVGFQTGIPSRIGKVKKQNTLEEAVVAIPFETVKNRRKFFKVGEGETIQARSSTIDIINKYVFPPKFDFVRNKSVEPLLMYVFEFAANITQQDVADIWQNLPPEIAEKHEQKEVVIEDENILELLVNNSEKIQWLVFKVKKRSKKSFEKFRRSLVAEDSTAFEENVGDYSYNWPYDYFSLVELIKLEETVQYATSDLLGDEQD